MTIRARTLSHRGRLAPASWLPRLPAHPGPLAGVLRLALLLITGAVGAALVHTVQYHLGLGSHGAAGAVAAAMLAECPLLGMLAIVLLSAGVTMLLVLYELRALYGSHRRLTVAAARVGLLPAATVVTLPRRPGRFAGLLALILGVQASLYAIADHLWPMEPLMRMDGVFMQMAPAGAVPLAPLQLFIAAGLAALVWGLERRLTCLRTAIARVQRLLGRFLSAGSAAPLPPTPAPRRLSVFGGPSALSRPPPA